MDLNWLDDVLVLLEEGNLTRAAERRNITQPAFSRRIRCFEDWLGQPILERSANRVAVSTALVSSEPEIRALVARLRDLRTNIAGFESNRTVVTIAAQHAPLCSSFPDMALRAKSHFPNLRMRLRAGNLGYCMSMFLRGDADMFLCYEPEGASQLEFGDSIVRGRWGDDYLVPVVGGGLRYLVSADGSIPENTPAIVYPEESYFGQVLKRSSRPYGTPSSTEDPICVTAFSSGTLELVLKGIGVGWLPYSMIHAQILSGALISLANVFGKEDLNVSLFASKKSEAAQQLLRFWTDQQ